MKRITKVFVWAMIAALLALAAFGIVKGARLRRIEAAQPVYEAAVSIAPEEMTTVG